MIRTRAAAKGHPFAAALVRLSLFVPSAIIEGMDVIYVDSLFFLNLAVNYFILLATARLCPHEPKRLRLAAGAALGGLYAVGTVLPGCGILLTAPAKLACGVGMVLTAFGGQGKLLRTTVIFLAVSAAFGGAVWAVSMLVGGFSPGKPYIPVSLPVLAAAFAVCYAAVSLAFRRVGKRAERKLVRVEVFLGTRRAAFSALVDTGNALCDPISGTPVIAAEADALRALLPPGTVLDGSAEEIFRRLSDIPELRPRLRLIPYAAVGVEAGLLPAIRPDRILVDGKPAEAHLVALAPNAVSPDGEYRAVV